MDLNRIDPYLACWSPEGVLAVATSAGVQLLVPDEARLLNREIYFDRVLLCPSRVYTFAFSSLDLKTGYSQLALVSENEEACLYTSSGEHVAKFPGRYTACCWRQSALFLASSENVVECYVDGERADYTGLKTALPQRVLSLKTSSACLAALLGDNSVYLFDFARNEWSLAVEPSPVRVYAIGFAGESLKYARTGALIINGETKQTADLPGYILNNTVLHVNGEFSDKRSPINGECRACCSHELGLACVFVSPTTSDWQYPILSWCSVKLTLFPVGEGSTVFSIARSTAGAYWLHMQTLKCKGDGLVLPDHDVVPCSVNELETSLYALFTSEWFNVMRSKWYFEQRAECVNAMRAKIAELLSNLKPSTFLDECVLSLYAAYLNPINPFAMTVEGDFLSEEFVYTNALHSKSKRAWKQCALTLLPVLSMNTRTSKDGSFVCYTDLPSVNASQSGVVAETLLNTAFCVFNGSQWRVDSL